MHKTLMKSYIIDFQTQRYSYVPQALSFKRLHLMYMKSWISPVKCNYRWCKIL